jgi:imidazolonepropionase
MGGGALAARHCALSADHLEHLNPAGVAAMAEAGTAAVLLPYAYYHLGDTHRPPVEALRRARVPIAIATDCNPGTSPMHSPLLLKEVACGVFGLTPQEALEGMTINAARALGLEAETGSLQVGKSADLAVWDIADPAALAPGKGHLVGRFLRGRMDGDLP